MTKREFGRLAIAHIYTLAALGLSLLLGRLVFNLVGGMPASIYGMMLLAVALRTGLLSEHKISMCVDFYLKYLLIVFLPVALGIMQYGDLLADAGWKIVVVAITTTVSGIVLIGILAQRVFGDGSAR